MTGRIDVGLETPKYTTVEFDFQNGQKMCLVDYRKFGRVWIVDNPNTIVNHLGIEPLSSKFTLKKFNELIEKRIPCCDLLHPDHCLTEKQIAEIAHDIRMDLNLHDVFKQVDQHIMRYVEAAGIDNKDHWVEPHLPDLDRDLRDEEGISFM